jgi:anti-sigma factor RsiW
MPWAVPPRACNFSAADGSERLERDCMKCEAFLAMLSEYVDGTVDPGICAEFENHLAGCNPCNVVVDNIRKTIRLYQGTKPYELPAAFRNRLHAALSQRWKETHLPPGGKS